MAKVSGGNQWVAQGDKVYFNIGMDGRKHRIVISAHHFDYDYSFSSTHADCVSGVFGLAIPDNAKIGEYNIIVTFYESAADNGTQHEVGKAYPIHVFAQDEYEPNNERADAYWIARKNERNPVEHVYGTISYPSFTHIDQHGNVNSNYPGDKDWYAIEMRRGEEIAMELMQSYPLVLDCARKKNGNWVIDEGNSLFDEEVLEDTVYYIGVYVDGGEKWDVDYQLDISITTVEMDEEPNDHYLDAVPLEIVNDNGVSGNLIIDGDEDWYKFYGAEGPVKITLNGGPDDIKMNLYDTSGAPADRPLERSISQGDDQLIETELSSGVYYIKVYSEDNQSSTSNYRLKVIYDEIDDLTYVFDDNRNGYYFLWTTPFACIGTLQYGKTTQMTSSVSEKEVTKEHSVFVRGLDAVTKYYCKASGSLVGTDISTTVTSDRISFYTLDRYEINDTPVWANPSYAISSNPVVFDEATISDEMDQDWYTFSFDYPGWLTLELEDIPAGCDYTLMYDDPWQGIIIADEPTYLRIRINTTLQPIGVKTLGGYSDSEPYTLRATFKEDIHDVDEFFYGGDGTYSPTGNYSKSFVDLKSVVYGQEFLFQRTYNSRDFIEGVFGRGWSSNLAICAKPLERKILLSNGAVETRIEEDIIAVRLADGSMDLFQKEEDDTFQALSTHNKLSKTNGVYCYQTKEQTSYYFLSHGGIDRIVDRYGREIKYEWDGERITKITDPAGHDYLISYQNNRVVSIEDVYGNRTVNYTYDDCRMLAQVKDAGEIITKYHYYEEDESAKNYLYLKEVQRGERILETITYESEYQKYGTLKIATLTDQFGTTYRYDYQDEDRKTIITEELPSDSDKTPRIREESYDEKLFMTLIKEEDSVYTIMEYNTVDGKNKYGEIKKMSQNATNSDISSGQITEYTWDERGNLTKVVYPDGQQVTSGYDEKNNLIWQLAETGIFTRYCYDEKMVYLLETAVYLGKLDEEAEKPEYTNASRGQFAVNSYTYGDKGVLLSETNDHGFTKIYTYDTVFHNLQTVTLPESTTENPMVRSLEYNAWGLVAAEVSPEGHRIEYLYDGNGHEWKKTYQVEPVEVYRTVYDKEGKVVQEISPNQYDSSQEESSGGYLDDTVGQRYTYDEHGLLAMRTDAMGESWQYTYDGYGNCIMEKRPDGSIYYYTYDAKDRVLRKQFAENQNAVPVLLEEYQYQIVEKQNVVTKTIHFSPTQTLVVIETFDFANRLVERKEQAEEKIAVTTYQYYGLSEEKYLEVTDAEGFTTKYTYDEVDENKYWRHSVWLPLSDSTYQYQAQVYDGTGLLLQTITSAEPVAAAGIPPVAKQWQKSYQYNKNGQMISEEDNLGRKTEYRYDKDGNQVEKSVLITGEAKQISQWEYQHLGKPTVQRILAAGEDLVDENGAPLLATSAALVSKYIYDKNGNLSQKVEVDAANADRQKVETYGYDAKNRQTSASIIDVNEYGQETTMSTTKTYGFDDQITSQTDPLGYETKFIYDAWGNLIYEVDAKQGITMAVYDWAGREIASVDKNNYTGCLDVSNLANALAAYETDKAQLANMNRLELTYDGWNRQIAEKRIAAQEEGQEEICQTYQYDKLGRLISEVDGMGYETTYTYDAQGRCLNTLKPESKLQQKTFTTQKEYDAMGNVLAERNGNGTEIIYTYDLAGRLLTKTAKKAAEEQLMVSNTYNGLDQVVTMMDGNGNSQTRAYNTLGKVSSVILPGDESIPGDVIHSYYDGFGNLALEKTDSGKQQQYCYDKRGNLRKKTVSKTDGSQAITTQNQVNAKNQLRFAVDGNGNIVEYEYDALGRQTLQRQTTAVADGTLAKTYEIHTGYDAMGNVITQTKKIVVNDVATVVESETSSYDPWGRVLTKHNGLNQLIRQYTYNKNHLQTAATDALGNVTQFIYDQNNRLIETRLPLYTEGAANKTCKTYDEADLVLTETDGNGNITQFAYDLQNRLAQVVQNDGSNEIITSYTYDANGNRLSQTDGNGNTKTFVYNCRNLLSQTIDPGAEAAAERTESYQYDALGNLFSKTDRNGQETTYTFDIHGRELSKTCGDLTESKTYDQNGNLLTMTDTTGSTTYTYDVLNRILTVNAPNTGGITYQYDDLSEAGLRRDTMTDSKGNQTRKYYDQAGRLSKVADATAVAATYSYFADGSLQQVAYASGAKEVYTYDANRRLLTLENRRPDDTLLDCFTYAYDGAGNQISKQEVVKGVDKGTTLYTYDGLNRLASVQEPEGKQTVYTFDLAGNRKTETITADGGSQTATYTYDADNRLLTRQTLGGDVVETVTYTYDPNGNLLGKRYETGKTSSEGSSTFALSQLGREETLDKTAVYEYDGFNRLSKSFEGKHTVSYQYNGLGLRVSKTTDGQKEDYAYDQDKVVLTLDAAGGEVAHDLFGHHLLRRSVQGETLYYWYNGHGDVVALLDAAGSVVALYAYDAFGVPKQATGKKNNPYRYAGYAYDEETGLYYLKARYYDAEIGRFLQRDTYAGNRYQPLSLNLYTYCQNEPIMYHDPEGMASQAVTNIYPKEIIRYVKYKPGYSRIEIYDGKKLRHILLENVDYELFNGKAYFKEGYFVENQGKFNTRYIIKEQQSSYLRNLLLSEGMKVVASSDNSYIIATTKGGNSYVFRRAVDYTIDPSGDARFYFDNYGNIRAVYDFSGRTDTRNNSYWPDGLSPIIPVLPPKTTSQNSNKNKSKNLSIAPYQSTANVPISPLFAIDLREFVEGAGGTVEYDHETKTATVHLFGQTKQYRGYIQNGRMKIDMRDSIDSSGVHEKGGSVNEVISSSASGVVSYGVDKTHEAAFNAAVKDTSKAWAKAGSKVAGNLSVALDVIGDYVSYAGEELKDALVTTAAKNVTIAGVTFIGGTTLSNKGMGTNGFIFAGVASAMLISPIFDSLKP